MLLLEIANKKRRIIIHEKRGIGGEVMKEKLLLKKAERKLELMKE